MFFALAQLVFASVAFAQTLTGQYTCAAAGNYQLCQNLWGEADGTGNQNSTLISTSGNTVSWSTSWTWANNPNNVKSYANVVSNNAKGVQLSALTTAPTAWNWEYQVESSGIRADVSYDIWLGAASSGEPASTASAYEIMIWLSGQGGIQPVGSVATTGISLAGYTWNLWKGPNSNWQVLSFVSQDGDITDFNSDLKLFFNYLVANEGVASSLYLQAVQTGTEPFTGDAVLLTNSFSVSVSTSPVVSSSAPPPPPSSSSAPPPPPPSTTTTPLTSTHPNPTSTSSAPAATQSVYGQCGGTGWTGPTACASGSTCTAVSAPYYSQCLP